MSPFTLAKNGVTQGSDALQNLMTGAFIYTAYVLFGLSLPELLVTGIVFFQIVNNLTKLQKQVQIAVVVESAYVRTMELIRTGRGAERSPYGRCRA